MAAGRAITRDIHHRRAGGIGRRHRRFHHRPRQHDDPVGHDHDRNQPAIGRRTFRGDVAARHHGFALQSLHRHSHAHRLGYPGRIPDGLAPGGLRHHGQFHCRPHHSGHRQRRYPRQQCRHDLHARRYPTAERPAGARSRRRQLDDDGRKLSHRVHRWGPSVAVVDADVSIIDNDSPTLTLATVTLTNGNRSVV